jgi:hypothetical protein
MVLLFCEVFLNNLPAHQLQKAIIIVHLISTTTICSMYEYRSVCGICKYKLDLVLSSDSHEVWHQEVLVFKSPTSGQSLIVENFLKI